MNKMRLAEQELLNSALDALRDKLAISEVSVIQCGGEPCDRFDAIVRIMGVDFLCDVKNAVTTANAWSVVGRLRMPAVEENKPILLIAKYVSPAVIDDWARSGINVLDCAGNCHIRYEKENKVIFHLANRGEKNVLPAQQNYPAFQEAGLKVIFYLLQDDVNADRPYREIQLATGVSLGAVKNVFDTLQEKNFVRHAQGKRKLKNKGDLFRLWVENYNQVLKPKLLLGRMSFRTDEQRVNWTALKLPEGMYWGGEGGADKVDNYLEPGAFDVYTDIPAANLLKTGMVKQDSNGEIKIYQKFWKWETENQIAPLTLIYADLMGSGSSRCLEMAERLMDYGLEDYK